MPPVAFTLALPVFAPKQFTLVCALMLLASPAPGSVIVAELVVVQPRASVIVQVQVPAEMLLAVAVD